MSKRGAYIEEFDDDTDLPLPNQPLPNTGARGHLLEEIDSDDDLDFTSPQAGPASPPAAKSQFRPHPADSEPSNRKNMVTDITPYKKYVLGVVAFQSLTSRKLVVRISHLHRCETSVWDWTAEDLESEECMVALEQGHGGRRQSPRTWYPARSHEITSSRLGEPWTRADTLEERWSSHEPEYQNKYVLYP